MQQINNPTNAVGAKSAALATPNQRKRIQALKFKRIRGGGMRNPNASTGLGGIVTAGEVCDACKTVSCGR